MFMRLICTLQLAALLLTCSLATFVQAPKSYAKDGVAFEYPSGWTVQDASKADSQQLTLARADSDAQIKVFVYRSKITADKVAEARTKLVDPYVESTFKTFQQMGANPQRSAINTVISSVPAEGVKIGATLEGEPGAALIYWAVIGERLVVLTHFGPDKALKQTAGAWELVTKTLTLEEPKPSPSPTPTPK
jgi:hypothetical protein